MSGTKKKLTLPTSFNKIFTMNKINRHILFLIVFFSISLCASEYNGRVIDALSGAGLASVNIYLKNSNQGTTSNTNGDFILQTNRADGPVVFEHIGYKKRELPLSELKETKTIALEPIVLQTPGVRVESEYEPVRIIRDLPQSYKIIQSPAFEARGYIDAGDLLKTEQSIQIQEEFSGRKTVSMRSGNADDVLVLYNGIKMNNTFDNTFDLSLLNLDDVEQIEVIKGSHSSLYGAAAFSGIINIVPKTQRDYFVKFQQRFGSYNSGVWNAQLYYTLFDRLDLSYTQKRGSAQRQYAEATFSDDFLENNVLHHSANAVYHFSANPDKNNFNLMYLRTEGTYENTRHFESLENMNEMFSASYDGDIGFAKNIHIAVASQEYQTGQFIFVQPDFVDRRAENHSYHFNFDKRFLYKDAELLLGYQLQDATLDFSDTRRVTNETPAGIKKAQTRQLKQGAVAIAKLHAPGGSPLVNHADFDISYRYDAVHNNIDEIVFREDPENADTEFDWMPPASKNWHYSTVKFSTRLAGTYGDYSTELFFNNGVNVKFPSLFQQLSSPRSIGANATYVQPSLNPEKANSLEVGLVVRRFIRAPSNVKSWQVNAGYFHNNYENKFRSYYLHGIPLAFYDNVQTARISGFEFNGQLKMFDSRISAEVGLSDYNVSSKSAFPFKSDFKAVFNLGFKGKGFDLKCHWFYENEQIGWVRDKQGEFYDVVLPGHANVDVYLSKTFRVLDFKPYLDFTVRNLFDDDTTVEGIAIRDRRIYITFGIQY